MTEKPKVDIRRYRLAFIQEKEDAEIELQEGMRTCVGYPTLPDKTAGETVCGKELPKGLRYYCSGEGLINAKKNGTYRN